MRLVYPIWTLISEAWNLNEIAHIVGDALTALTLLKLDIKKKLTFEEDKEKLKKYILAVKPILSNLLREVDKGIKLNSEFSPLVKALQEEYGYADLKKIRRKLKDALNVLKQIERENYKEEELEDLERILECIANEASSRSYELLARANPY